MLQKKSVKQFQYQVFAIAVALLLAGFSTGVTTRAHAADTFDELAPVAQPESPQPQQPPSAQPAAPAQPAATPESSDDDEDTVLV